MWIIQMSRKNELKKRATESKGQCYTALPVTVLVHTMAHIYNDPTLRERCIDKLSYLGHLCTVSTPTVLHELYCT